MRPEDVDPSFDTRHLNALKTGQFWSGLRRWRAENPGIAPNLRGAWLKNADLSGGDLRGVDLSDANLEGANLSGAALSEADLRSVRLTGACLSAADLSRVCGTGASFASADLKAADLSQSMFDGANFRGALLDDAKLGSTDFGKADFTGATLKRAFLAEASFPNARLDEADLTGANLGGARFYSASLVGAKLVESDLHNAILENANLTRAALRFADLGYAHLTMANLSESDCSAVNLRGTLLFNTNFTRANLQGAALLNAIAVGTNFSAADLTSCRVYGLAAWDVDLEGAIQSKLVITREEPHVHVDDLEVAQFIHLLLHRQKLRNVLTTLGEKSVLILGRFTERKALLDAIADKVRALGYLPIVFDFDRPTDRDLTETVKVLAGLSLFVIADITNPRSVPLELQATVPDYMVPFVTVVERGQPVFGMFDDLPRKYDWALPLLEYSSADSLIASFEHKVLEPALEKLESVRRRKALPPARRSAED